MIQLVAGRKNEGYVSALLRSFKTPQASPAKSSLSKFRRKISYKFFATALNDLFRSFKRPTFRGMHVYAVDGKRVYIPRSESLEKQGFQGRVLSDYRETYQLVMHLTHAYDVLSGTTKDLVSSPMHDEHRDAQNMVKGFEKNSVTLYDRLYLSFDLLDTHAKAGNNFIMRCKKGSTLGEVVEFAKSSEKNTSFEYRGKKLYLTKVKTKNLGTNIFITNLDPKKFSAKDIELLYRWRWEVETSFKELTETLNLEQWHSGDYNNVLQELYARFWLFNATKALCFNRGDIRHDPTSDFYWKVNFKLCVEWFVRHFNEVMRGARGIFKELKNMMRISTEKRKRYSRTYKREIKTPASPYKRNNTIFKVNGVRI